MARVALHVAEGVFRAAFQFPRLDGAQVAHVKRRWSLKLLQLFNVRLKVRGDPPGVAPRSAMVVGNHVSWLDIFAIMAVSPSHFVSKAEVRNWPLIGWLSARTGTLFLERGRRQDTVRVNIAMRELLLGGERLAVFPEGTTTEGGEVKPFHASLLQPAVDARAPICPVAIRYCRPDGSVSVEASYAGELSFAQSLRRILAQEEIHVELVFGAPIDSAGKSRAELARQSETAIASALRLPVPHRKPGRPSGPPAAAPSVAHPTGSPYPESQESR